MHAATIIPLLPMLLLLCWAAVQDAATRRIPNWLTVAMALSGIISAAIGRLEIGVWPSLAGLGIGFGIGFALFCIRALGGGDVKLLAGIGAWVGPMLIWKIFVVEALVGLVIVLVQCAVKGRLMQLFKNTAVLTVNIGHMNQLGAEHVAYTERTHRSVDRPLPYAVPVLAATWIVLSLSI